MELRPGIKLFLILSMAAFLTPTVKAAALNAMSSTIELTCAGEPTASVTTTKEINDGQCDLESGDFIVAAVAQAFLGDQLAFVQTSVTGARTAQAISTIDFQLRINEVAPPPASTSLIDIGSTLSAATQVIGIGLGTASATLTGPSHESGTVLALAPPDFDNITVSVPLEPNSVYDVALRASCNSAGSSVVSTSFCQAVIDPIIFFDQAASL